jgi:hypothetical protein
LATQQPLKLLFWVRIPTFLPNGLVVQWLRTRGFHPTNRGSIPLEITTWVPYRFPHGFLAQLAEQQTFNLRGLGSSPREPTSTLFLRKSSNSKMRPNLGEMRVRNPSFRSNVQLCKLVKQLAREVSVCEERISRWTPCADRGMAVSPGLEPGVCGFDSHSAHQCVCGVNGQRACLKTSFCGFESHRTHQCGFGPVASRHLLAMFDMGVRFSQSAPLFASLAQR